MPEKLQTRQIRFRLKSFDLFLEFNDNILSADKKFSLKNPPFPSSLAVKSKKKTL